MSLHPAPSPVQRQAGAFAIDVLQCPCGGRRELISVIQDDKTKVRILDHVGINSTPPRFAAARAPPQEQWLDDSWG